MLKESAKELARRSDVSVREAQKQQVEVAKLLFQLRGMGHVELILAHSGDLLLQGVLLPGLAAKEILRAGRFHWRKTGCMKRAKVSMHFVSRLLD
jgi:hypothetical protein